MAKSSKNISNDVILFLVGGGTVGGAISVAVKKGIPDPDAKKIVSDARKKITRSASLVGDKRFSAAVERVESILGSAQKTGDIKTALQAQKELNRLYGLYSQKSDVDVDCESESDRKIRLIEDYIYPLNLADERYPIEEHVRRAAEKIRQQAAI